jgi:mono/diheme cytochrome c family protein
VIALGVGLTLLAAALMLWLLRRDAVVPEAGITQTAQVGDLRVTLQIDQPQLGIRTADLFIDGRGLQATVSAVRLRFSMPAMEMGAIEVDAQPVQTGHFRAQGQFFTMAGQWAVEALLMQDGQTPVRVPFALAVAAPGEASGPLNPLPSDEATITAGRLLYQANCAACHGVNGKGDGPMALGLRPGPSDFTQHMPAGKHTDGQVYLWIKDGYPQSAMPAWGQRLNDQQIWQLVTFIRTFGRATTPTAASSPAAAAQPTAAVTAAPAPDEPLPPLIFTRGGNIWRSDGSQRPPQQLTTLAAGSYAQNPVIAPAGDRIAFVMTSQGPLGPEEWPQLNPETRLAVMRADGSDLQVIWDPERGVLGQPAWAPDGRSVDVAIADVLSPPGAPVPDRLFQIVRVDPATKARVVALESAYDLAFSRDGQMMVFLHWKKDLAAFTLNVAAVDGSGEREVIPWGTFSNFSAPRFSPDRRHILFVSTSGPPTDEQGNPITRSDPSPLDRLLSLFAAPVAEAHGASADVWIVNVDGTGLRRLTKLREDSPMGVFSSDGVQIAVEGAGGIYLMNADGSNVRKIDPVGDHGGLDWAR